MRNEALNVLVVDDNPVLTSVLSEIFHECGHNVRVASDGFFALAEIRNRVPDVLLSDLSMPGMSGYELLSVVRRRYPAVRVIAMSGSYSGENVPTGVAADAFYAKGASSITQLIQMVRTIWHNDSVLPRSVAPVWISEINFNFDSAASPVLLASCPECLRPFPNRLGSDEAQPREETCPHCLMPLELAFVRQQTGMDGTPISFIPSRPRVNHSAFEARRGGGNPTGRMTQQ
jgi:CheY-like chemotaxis protein